MSLSLSPSQALNLQASTPSQTVQPARPGHAVNSGSPTDGVNSTDILKGEKTVAIHHNGLIYRLQATRLGKLILTK